MSASDRFFQTNCELTLLITIPTNIPSAGFDKEGDDFFEPGKSFNVAKLKLPTERDSRADLYALYVATIEFYSNIQPATLLKMYEKHQMLLHDEVFRAISILVRH